MAGIGVALTALLVVVLVSRCRRTRSEAKRDSFYPVTEDQSPLRERYRNRTIRGLGASVQSTQKILGMYQSSDHDGDEGLEMIDEGPDADLSGYLASMPNDQKMLMEKMRSEGSNGSQNYLVDVAARLKSTITALLEEVEEHEYTAFFERLQEVGVEQMSETAQLETHELKNRYNNVLPYDHSRVVLPLSNDDPTTDYVNASFIDGYYRPQAYIATQGPVPNSFAAFWRMVWHCNVSVIVMTTQEWEGGRRKCDRYWPDPTSTPTEKVKDLGVGLSVHHLETTQYEYWITRKFTIKYSGWQREVTQICYTAWPDHGVPESADEVLLLRLEVHRLTETSVGPIVVHCSAGVGRTGTYIAIDRLIDRCTNADGQLDVEGCITDMRMSRNMMVQTEPQYLFIYDALLHAVNTLLTIEKAGGRKGFDGGPREYDSVKGAQRSVSLLQPVVEDASTDSLPKFSTMHSEHPGSMLTTSTMSSTFSSESTLMLSDSKTSIRFKSTHRSNPLFQNDGASGGLSGRAARRSRFSSSTDEEEPAIALTATIDHDRQLSVVGRLRSQSYGAALEETAEVQEEGEDQMFVVVNKAAPTIEAPLPETGSSNEDGRTHSYGDALELIVDEDEDEDEPHTPVAVSKPTPTLSALLSATSTGGGDDVDDDGPPPAPPPRPSLAVAAPVAASSKDINPGYVLPPPVRGRGGALI